MKNIIRIGAVVLLCVTFGQTYSRNIPLYEQAIKLNTFRTHYPAFCQAIGAPVNQFLVPGPKADSNAVHPSLLPYLRAILQEANSGFSGNTPPPAPVGRDDIFDDGAQPTLPGRTSTPSTTSFGNAVKMQDLIREWYYAEAFVMSQGQQVDSAGTLNLSNANLVQGFPADFEYLKPIAAQVQGVAQTGYSTSSPLSGLLGSIPQAEIIQGIVDFAIERAREELLQAFLQGWLDDLESNPILKAAFPNTLNLLATTDLSTIFSQGDVWKAAFKQDLDAIPANMPAIVTQVLDAVPRKIPTTERREVIGAVNVASQLYLQLDRNHNNLSDAISLTARILMLQRDTLAYSERAVLGTDVLMSAVQTLEKGKPAVVTPRAILDLEGSKLCDFWNVIYLHNRRMLLRALGLQQSDSLYYKVLLDLEPVQLVLAKTADILQNVDDVLQVKNTSDTGDSGGKVTFQEVNTYYALIMELLDNSLDLVIMVDPPAKNVKRLLDKVVAPLGKDMLGIVEGISTQQYGLVVTNSIGLLRVLSAQVIKDPVVRNTIDATGNLLDQLQQFQRTAKGFQGYGSTLKSRADSLLSEFLQQEEDYLTSEVIKLLADVRDGIRAFPKDDLPEVKTFLKKEMNQLGKDLKAALKDLDIPEGLEKVAADFNKYGRLMVNILTASTSDEVKAALDDAAAPVGSFMVKQTSKSSITLSFFPGVQAGYEFASTPASLAATGGDTLIASDQGYLGATLPIGLEFAKGLRSSVIGAIGLYVQVADLGAVLNYRLANPGDSVSISPEIGFAQVLAPGATLILHAAKVPIVFGAGVSYSPELRSISSGNASYNLNMLQVGGFIAVDVTVFQLFASRRKISSRNGTYE